MVVPNPGTVGSSPDFTSGPIIPNALFPIHVAGQTFRNNQPWDPYLLAFDVPPLTDQLSCPFSVDGHSHFPIFIADNASFGSGGPTGHYEYRVTMMDATGNGWSITVRFTVRPGISLGDNQPSLQACCPARNRPTRLRQLAETLRVHVFPPPLPN